MKELTKEEILAMAAKCEVTHLKGRLICIVDHEIIAFYEKLKHHFLAGPAGIERSGESEAMEIIVLQKELYILQKKLNLSEALLNRERGLTQARGAL